jgi:hypothetical protein
MFRGWHLSVFEPTYYQLNVGMSAAGIAYFVLVAAGVASFALAFRACIRPARCSLSSCSD